jgi:hypothetical protein
MTAASLPRHVANPGQIARRPDPVEVFSARCEARAYLWAEAEIADLHDAVDQLQHDALRDGLVGKLGQDGVQALIGRAFAAVRQPCVAVEPARDVVPDLLPVPDEAPKRGLVPKATLDAAKYVARQNDPERLRRWLNGRSANARAAIQKHLKGTRCSAQTR